MKTQLSILCIIATLSHTTSFASDNNEFKKEVIRNIDQLDWVKKHINKDNVNMILKKNTKEQPLHLATQKTKETDIIEYLLRTGASVNAETHHHETPLYFAAQKGSLEVVQTLLKKGADPNIKTENDDTALHKAVENDNLAVAKNFSKQGGP